ncbi:MAG: hypothetical protein ACRD0D_06190, partial [Acidimicrobiales bacterium]
VVGDVVQAVTYSKLGPKPRLVAWAHLLALTASHPERPFRSAVVGRAREGEGVEVATAGPLGESPGERRQVALGHLATLVELFERAMREPLPLYLKTSAAYAATVAGLRGRRSRPGEEARKEWESDWRFDLEDRDPEHRLVLGGVVPFAQVLAATPAPGEGGPGWADDEPSRFGRLSRRLWAPVLASERVVHQ